MKEIVLTNIKVHTKKIIFISLGAVAGFLYYVYIGCASGSCPITSNPYISTVYGGVMGYLFSDIGRTKNKEQK